MPAELRLTTSQFEELQLHLLSDDAEHAALLVCGVGGARAELLLCREVIALTNEDLEATSGRLHLHISPLALARHAKRAAAEGTTIVLCHSHPFPGTVTASAIDLETENDLCGRVLPGRMGGRPSGALILGPDGYDARRWWGGNADALRVKVGSVPLEVASPPSGTNVDERDSRQLLVWGANGQRRLRAARVAVIGVGGTGSHVVLQLAHLGIGHLMLIDPDVVETSNLSRLVGATADDVGEAKVAVIGAAASRVRAELELTTVRASLLDIDVRGLADCDAIICCTDGHGSRALLTELAAQYLVPLVDLGVEVQSGPHGSRAGGGVRVVRPGDPCLHCMAILDPALVREEFLSDAERQREAERGYLRGTAEPAPSVIALNGVVASLAVLEVLHQVLGLFASSPRRLLYRAEARALTTATVARDPGCFVCGGDGVLGLGDARRLARRVPEPRTG